MEMSSGRRKKNYLFTYNCSIKGKNTFKPQFYKMSKSNHYDHMIIIQRCVRLLTLS